MPQNMQNKTESTLLPVPPHPLPNSVPNAAAKISESHHQLYDLSDLFVFRYGTFYYLFNVFLQLSALDT